MMEETEGKLVTKDSYDLKDMPRHMQVLLYCMCNAHATSILKEAGHTKDDELYQELKDVLSREVYTVAVEHAVTLHNRFALEDED